MDSYSLKTEIKRKLFHLLALIYVAGILFLDRNIFILILLGLLAVEVATELLRLRNQNVRSWFISHFNILLREHEQTHFSGVTWMTLGVLLTAVLIRPPHLAATVLLYLIFGDAAASLAGKQLHGPHWPNSPKRLTGSLACFLVCLLVGVLMLRPGYSWNGIVLGALAATIVEIGFVQLNDNLLIPLACSIVFILTYALWNI